MILQHKSVTDSADGSPRVVGVAGPLREARRRLVNAHGPEVDLICNLFPVTLDQLVMTTRRRSIAAPRQALMALLKTKPLPGGKPRSFPAIAKLFPGTRKDGYKDHATVLYAQRKIGKLMRRGENNSHNVLTPEKLGAIATYAAARAIYGCMRPKGSGSQTAGKPAPV